MIKENLAEISEKIAKGNNLGEKITLVGATKFVDIENINLAISLGLSHIGENKAQEFRDKFPFYAPCFKHFIGSIQSNKLTYIVGKADCIDSVSSIDILLSVNDLSAKLQKVQNVMIEINAGNEESKTGTDYKTADFLYKTAQKLDWVGVCGFMVMLPDLKDKESLAVLCKEARAFFDEKRKTDLNLKYLSMGMSGDYEIAVENGSNMIRLGTAIFGQRNYGVK